MRGMLITVGSLLVAACGTQNLVLSDGGLLTSSSTTGAATTVAAASSSGTTGSTNGATLTGTSSSSSSSGGPTTGSTTSGACAPGNWTLTTVDLAPVAGQNADVGLYPKVVADSHGGLHASYQAIPQAGLENLASDQRYALRTASGTWSSGVIEEGIGAGGSTALAIDGFDNLYVAFTDTVQNAAVGPYPALDYAYQPADGGFTETQVFNSGTEFGSLGPIFGGSIGFDRTAEAHLFFGVGGEDSSFTSYVGTLDAGFTECACFFLTDGGASVSAAVLPSGAANVAYAFGDQGFGYVAIDPMGDFSSTYEDTGTINTIALALDSQGATHVVYDIDDTADAGFGSTVRYGDLLSDGGWGLGTIEAGEALAPSLALDSSGNEYVVYRTLNEIRYAVRSAGATGWTISTVANLSPEDQPNPGEAPTIVVDGTGAIHVLYYDWNNADLVAADLCAG